MEGKGLSTQMGAEGKGRCAEAASSCHQEQQFRLVEAPGLRPVSTLGSSWFQDVRPRSL